MNAAMQVISVIQMRTVPTLLGLTNVLAKKGSLEMDVHVQVEIKSTRLTDYGSSRELESGLDDISYHRYRCSN